MIFKPHHMEKLHWNSTRCNLFGLNSTHHHNNLKAFFACQNHPLKYQPKTKFPIWRVQPLLMSMEFIFPIIWVLDVAFSIYEMSIHFKVHHADKKGWCINQKVMDNRHMLFVRKDIYIKYLFAIILHQKPYLDKSIFPLHDIVMALFYTVEVKHPSIINV